ncbi:MAG: phage portal protein [Desulfurellales bacterium]|nr:MAG: phage portal protein [Desulfurellales bacterium]
MGVGDVAIAPMDGPSLDSAEAQARAYQTFAWVQIAVRALAVTAASVPIYVKKIGPGERQSHVDNHPMELLLRHPNPWYSQHELIEATVAYRALTGNAYWYLNRPSADVPPLELWIIPPHMVYPVLSGASYVAGYDFTGTGGERIRLEPWQVCHFKVFNPLDPFIGMSPLDSVRYDLAGDMAMQRYNARMYDTAGLPPGILAFADPINDPAFEQIQRDIADHGRKKQAFVLRGVGQGGVQWLPMAVNNVDMQYLEGRQFTKEEILALFAPGLASILAINATEANAMAGRATFMDMAVWPALCAIAESLTNNLLPSWSSQRIEYVAEFEDVRQTDQAMELQQIQTASGVMTVNEIRQKYYGLDELPDERGAALASDRLQSATTQQVSLTDLYRRRMRDFDAGA